MNYSEIASIVRHCTYKPNWAILLREDKKGVYVQLSVTGGIDSCTFEKTDWKSGKRYFSEWMCRQEVVGVVFGLIKDAEMHEIHEFFRYKKASIFNPHLDPEALVKIAKRKDSFDMRKNAMSMEEAG